MEASALLQKTQQDATVNGNLLSGVDVSYYHVRSGNTEQVRCMFKAETRETAKGVFEYKFFSSLHLNEEPTASGDYIVLDGEKIIITRWTKSEGTYEVIAETTESSRNRRRSR